MAIVTRANGRYCNGCLAGYFSDCLDDEVDHISHVLCPARRFLRVRWSRIAHRITRGEWLRQISPGILTATYDPRGEVVRAADLGLGDLLSGSRWWIVEGRVRWLSRLLFAPDTWCGVAHDKHGERIGHPRRVARGAH